jgi:hypothetical protein
MTSDQIKMQAMMTNCLVAKMPTELVASTLPLTPSAQKNHSSGSLPLSNIKISYVKDMVLLISQATIISQKKTRYTQWCQLRIWNDFIMGPGMVV